MGCLQSKPVPKKIEKPTPAKAAPPTKKGLSKDEVQMRIVAPEICHTYVQSGVTIKYAWASQRGYYPDAPDKENQDSFSAEPHLSSSLPDVALFGVYDGHGGEGHVCSRFVRTQVTNHIITNILLLTR